MQTPPGGVQMPQLLLQQTMPLSQTAVPQASPGGGGGGGGSGWQPQPH